MNRSLLNLLAAACILLPAAVRGATTDSTVTVNGTVAQFAEWSATTGTINIGTPLSSLGAGGAQTGSINLTLYANKAATITAVGGTNGGVLMDTATSTHSVTTRYMLTGVGLGANADGAFKAADATAGNFFNAGNTYPIDYTAGVGSYAITLTVEMSATGAAPVSGNYTCDVVLTATY